MRSVVDANLAEMTIRSAVDANPAAPCDYAFFAAAFAAFLNSRTLVSEPGSTMSATDR